MNEIEEKTRQQGCRKGGLPGDELVKERAKTAVWVGAPFVFWIVLAMVGLPGPHPCDDLVFVPPAVEWAKGHVMHNPQLHQLLAAWGMQTDRWFAHWPVYPLILGVWLRLAGISSAAMLGFQAAVNCGTQLGFWAASRRLGAHPAWTWLAAGIYFCATLTWGMRPEATGFCFLVAGAIFLFEAGAGSSFLAGLFLAASAACLPQAAIFSAMLVAAFLAANFRRMIGQPAGRIRLLCLLGGCLPVALAFDMGIGGDWSLFLTDYHRHMQIGMALDKGRLAVFSSYVAFYSFGLEWVKGILDLLGIGICVWGMMRLPSRLVRYGLAAILVATGLNVCSAVPGAYRLGFLNAVLGATSLCVLHSLLPRVAWTRLVCAASLAGIPLLLSAPGVIGMLAGERTNGPEIARLVAARKGQLIYCDSPAVWDVFDWQLPEGVESLHLSVNWTKELRDGAVVIVSETQDEFHPLRLFGRVFHSVPVNARSYRLREVKEGSDRKVGLSGSAQRWE